MASASDIMNQWLTSTLPVGTDTTHEETSMVKVTPALDPLFSDNARHWMEIVFFATVTWTISLLGSIANVLNIIIFSKQGYRDTVNVSLLGLAVSDLGCLLTFLWMCLCFNPLLRNTDLPFDSTDIQYITAGWPHVGFARTTSWITVYITAERCVCIAMPLKIKTILTVRRTVIIVVLIFVLMFLSVTPAFCAMRVQSRSNHSFYALVYVDNGSYLEAISYSITTVAQISSFVLVIVLSGVLIHHLILKSVWRRTAILVSSQLMSTRDKRVVKTVTLISCIFIACYLPSTINIILVLCFPSQYSVGGQFRNSFLSSWALLSTLEASNCTVNILVYYQTSSKFRATFRKLFIIAKNTSPSAPTPGPKVLQERA